MPMDFISATVFTWCLLSFKGYCNFYDLTASLWMHWDVLFTGHCISGFSILGLLSASFLLCPNMTFLWSQVNWQIAPSTWLASSSPRALERPVSKPGMISPLFAKVSFSHRFPCVNQSSLCSWETPPLSSGHHFPFPKDLISSPVLPSVVLANSLGYF